MNHTLWNGHGWDDWQQAYPAAGGHAGVRVISNYVAHLQVGNVMWGVYSQAWADSAEEYLKGCLTGVGADKKPIYTVDESRVKWKTSPRLGVQTCGYDATADFLAHILGVKLNDDDKSWYKACSIVELNGLPEIWTATVLHALVLPYGIGVSRIRLPLGYIQTGELARWADCLGRNPIDATGYNTTTEEFLATINQPSLGVAGMALDHGSEPLKPSVCAAYMGKGEVMTGHTIYIGARSPRKDFRMSVQFDRLSNISYHEPPPTLDYEAAFDKEPMLWEVLADDGKPMRQVTTGAAYTKPAQTVTTKPKKGQTVPTQESFSFYRLESRPWHIPQQQVPIPPLPSPKP